jgi:6-pyruvoyltetrahydropterin/6-carboxytetrahydropterin synthase
MIPLVEALPQIEVTRRIRWEASHSLPRHSGECARTHGHSWQAWITVRGQLAQEGEAEGMVLDMGELAAYFRSEVEPGLDHQHLNDTLPEEYLPPTTENVARFLLVLFTGAGFPVIRVTVQETENQSATAAWEDRGQG